MRLLLFIALALLPLSTALKCYEGTDAFTDGQRNAKSVDKKVKTCPGDSAVCAWLSMPDVMTMYRCGLPGDKTGDGDKAICGTQEVPVPHEGETIKIVRDVCMCKEDLCNESKVKAELSVRGAPAPPSGPTPDGPKSKGSNPATAPTALPLSLAAAAAVLAARV